MAWLDNIGFWFEIGIFILIANVFALFFILIPNIMDRKEKKRKEVERKEQIRYKIDREHMNKIKRMNQ